MAPQPAHPVTDNVELTRADKSAYTSYAQTEQHKGFETIDVAFPSPIHPSRTTSRVTDTQRLRRTACGRDDSTRPAGNRYNG
jgi:hypothetical protein